MFSNPNNPQYPGVHSREQRKHVLESIPSIPVSIKMLFMKRGSAQDLPGGPVVKNLSANAVYPSLIPGLGGSESVYRNYGSPCALESVHHNKKQALVAATRESPCSNEDPAQTKIINNFFFKERARPST